METDMRYSFILFVAGALAFLSAIGCSNKPELERAQSDADKNKNEIKAPVGEKPRIRISKCDEVIYYDDKAPLVEVRVDRENYSGPIRVTFWVPDYSARRKDLDPKVVPPFIIQPPPVSYIVPSGQDRVRIDVGRCINESNAAEAVGSHEAKILVRPTTSERIAGPEDEKKISELKKSGKWPEEEEKVVRLVIRERKR
jgi:hypothetical protein